MMKYCMYDDRGPCFAVSTGYCLLITSIASYSTAVIQIFVKNSCYNSKGRSTTISQTNLASVNRYRFTRRYRIFTIPETEGSSRRAFPTKGFPDEGPSLQTSNSALLF